MTHKKPAHIREFLTGPRVVNNGRTTKITWHGKVSLHLGWVTSASICAVPQATKVTLAGTPASYVLRVRYVDFIGIWARAKLPKPRSNADNLARRSGPKRDAPLA